MCTAVPGNCARILIISAESVLANTRKGLIELHPGWEATISRNKQHALALLHKEFFHLLVLCNSLSATAQAEFASIYRQKNPQGKILAIIMRGGTEFEANAVLSTPVSPEDFISAVNKLLTT